MRDAVPRSVLTPALASEVQQLLGWDTSQPLRGIQGIYMHGQLVQANRYSSPLAPALDLVACLPLHPPFG